MAEQALPEHAWGGSTAQAAELQQFGVVLWSQLAHAL